MNWIRIQCGIGRDPSILTMADRLKVQRSTVVGCVVNLLSYLPAAAPDGDLSGISDGMLELWADWQGKSGTFAAAFRAQLCTPQGVVRSWDKHNGSAIRRAKEASARTKAWRERHDEPIPERNPNTDVMHNSTHNVMHNGTHTEHVRYAVRNETLRNETKSSLVNPSDVVAAHTRTRTSDRQAATTKRTQPAEHIAQAFKACQHVVLPAHHDALADLLHAVPSPTTWASILTGMHSGLSSPNNRPIEPYRLGAAVQDFVASGKHRQASPGLFRGFVDKAKAAPKPTNGYADPLELRADDLRALREQNARRLHIGQPPIVEPADAAQLDAMFPDGRTQPALIA